MSNANIILLGATGVGKTTLINAVLGSETLLTTRTSEVEEYYSEELGITLVDTVGFELRNQKKQVAVKKILEWTKDGIQKGDEAKSIDAVWFCVDGTAPRLFGEHIKNLTKAIRHWKNVPVIVVITKSYSETEQVRHMDLVDEAFAKYAKSINLKRIIPVVAKPFMISEDYIIPQSGLEHLIDWTMQVIPEGSEAKRKAIDNFKLKRKRMWAQSVIVASTGSAATIGAVPIPFPDGALLAPLEAAEIRSIAKIYGIDGGTDSDKLIKMLVEMGTAGIVAKMILNGLKAVPAINIAADILNAIVAGSIVAAIGEGSQIVFEQIYLGKKSVTDTEWVKNLMETTIGKTIAGNIDEIVRILQRKGKISMADVLVIIKKVFIDKK